MPWWTLRTRILLHCEQLLLPLPIRKYNRSLCQPTVSSRLHL
ncbi:hypothetical protein OESDEN_10243 [Oesophagostomum dentatum]|uniref:Uncharacterized protein n=1 Tax=Oesophagostomum dentatum TaxID=61180 RepID=A0A0B1T294_OESDE|nr:hypothetical protein OESDEN_10243 [Oesophagostomum dentatum]